LGERGSYNLPYGEGSPDVAIQKGASALQQGVFKISGGKLIVLLWA